FATFVGQGTIREQVVGLANRKATPDEIEKMKSLAAQAMRDGAFGLSSGLFYVPGNFTPTEEVIELAKVVGRMGGMYISHMREEAGARGVDATIDQYPYTASSTGIAALFPRLALEGGQTAVLERLAAPAERSRIKMAIVENINNDRGGGDPANVVITNCSFDP